MSSTSVWSRGRASAPSRWRGTRPNRYRRGARTRPSTAPRLAWNRPEASRTAVHLGRVGRTLVGFLLVGVSLAVLGRGADLQAEVTGRVIGWLEDLGVRNVPLPAVKPAAAPGRTVRRPAVAPARPLAWISDGGLFWLDVLGTVHAQDGYSGPGDLPVITGVTVREVPADLGIGLEADVDLPALKRILGSTWKDQISEVHAESGAGWVLYTRDGSKILLRRGPTLERDLERLGAVLADIRVKHKDILLIDMRRDQSVVVRPRHGR